MAVLQGDINKWQRRSTMTFLAKDHANRRNSIYYPAIRIPPPISKKRLRSFMQNGKCTSSELARNCEFNQICGWLWGSFMWVVEDPEESCFRWSLTRVHVQYVLLCTPLFILSLHYSFIQVDQCYIGLTTSWDLENCSSFLVKDKFGCAFLTWKPV